MGDGGGTVPRPLQIMIELLGAPIVLIFADASKFNYVRRFFDDSGILMTLALFNSIIWGVAVTWLIGFVQRRLSNNYRFERSHGNDGFGANREPSANDRRWPQSA